MGKAITEEQILSDIVSRIEDGREKRKEGDIDKYQIMQRTGMTIAQAERAMKNIPKETGSQYVYLIVYDSIKTKMIGVLRKKS